MLNRLLTVILLAQMPLCADAQVSRLMEDVQYGASTTATLGGGDNAPFWFTSNRYGLGAISDNTVMGRAYIQRNAEADSLRNWRIGYGADMVAAYGLQSIFTLQQAFVDMQWKMLRLSIGQKERASELKNPLLSSGGLVLGMNARPVPQVRIEMPDFWTVPGTRGLFAFKAHLAYGLYTDDNWQRGFTSGTYNSYTQGSWFHSKALFLKIGNKERFPLEFTLGVEMACQFKGRGYNILTYTGEPMPGEIALGGNVISALIPGVGEDVNDDVFSNSAGNHIGSYHFRLDWKASSWSVGAYMEHMFEDQSQMFMQYGFWKDMLLGVEVNLPRNPFVSTLLYEHNGTMNQSGPLYHDKTQENPLQISANDAYYRHHIYGSWQHGGFVMGNPLIPSPLYNNYFSQTESMLRGSLMVFHNRINAHHLALKGDPCDQLSWRLLYTHEMNFGSYDLPVKDPLYGDFLLMEATYRPKQVPGLSVTAAFGHNGGSLLGSADGGMLTLSWDGNIRRIRK